MVIIVFLFNWCIQFILCKYSIYYFFCILYFDFSLSLWLWVWVIHADMWLTHSKSEFGSTFIYLYVFNASDCYSPASTIYISSLCKLCFIKLLKIKMKEIKTSIRNKFFNQILSLYTALEVENMYLFTF